MTNQNQWKPGEIIVHQEVKDDPDTIYLLSQCAGIPVKYVDSGKAEVVIQASDLLRTTPQSMISKSLITGSSAPILSG